MTAQVYEGVVRHRRGEPAHRIAMRVRYVVDDAADVVGSRAVPGWPGARLRRTDLFDGTEGPLDAAVLDLVESRLGRRPPGRVLVLTQPRVLGWLFNPLSVMWCLDHDGDLDAVVLEVSNTPWHERHWYVLDAADVARGGEAFSKEMHVSPFMPMELAYRCRTSVPAEHAAVQLQLVRPSDGHVVFDAGLTARRLDGPVRGWARVRAATQTVRVSAAIYAHAAVLRAKGAAFHRHPTRVGASGAATTRSSA